LYYVRISFFYKMSEIFTLDQGLKFDNISKVGFNLFNLCVLHHHDARQFFDKL